MKDLGGMPDKPTTISEDNQGAIEQGRITNTIIEKHVDTCHHFIRERTPNEEISVTNCPSDCMAADNDQRTSMSTFERLR